MAEKNKSIFINYRRDDAAGDAGRLADRLGNHFGKHNIFLDVGSIELGLDFVESLERSLETCAVMLVVIGTAWVTELKEHERTGQEDFARLEVATALERNNVRVIPVLVEGALMPRAQELPDDLVALTRRQNIEVHHTNWESDVGYLIAQLEKILGRGEEGARSSEDDYQSPRDLATISVGRRNPDWRENRPLTVQTSPLNVQHIGGICLADKSGDQIFFSLTPMRFTSYRRSRRAVIFCHRYSTYTSHI